MHRSSLQRVQWFRDTFLPADPACPLQVLDIGSYDVNGTYRELFRPPAYQYVGADMAPGPGVDIALAAAYRWDELATDAFDVVISGQTFEHSEFFWLTMAECVRVLRQGGWLCLVAPQHWPEHRYPVDCYRFYTDGLVALARYTALEVLHAHSGGVPNWDDPAGSDTLLVARKPYAGAARLPDLASYRCAPGDHAALRAGLACPPSP